MYYCIIALLHNMLDKLDNLSISTLISFLKPTEYLNFFACKSDICSIVVDNFYWLHWWQFIDSELKMKSKYITKVMTANDVKKNIKKLLQKNFCHSCQLTNGKLTPLEIKLCKPCQALPQYHLITKTDAIRNYFLPKECVDKIEWIERKCSYGLMNLTTEKIITKKCIKFYGSKDIYKQILSDPEFRKNFRKEQIQNRYENEDKFLIKWLNIMSQNVDIVDSIDNVDNVDSDFDSDFDDIDDTQNKSKKRKSMNINAITKISHKNNKKVIIKIPKRPIKAREEIIDKVLKFIIKYKKLSKEFGEELKTSLKIPQQMKKRYDEFELELSPESSRPQVN